MLGGSERSAQPLKLNCRTIATQVGVVLKFERDGKKRDQKSQHYGSGAALRERPSPHKPTFWYQVPPNSSNFSKMTTNLSN